MKSHWRARAEEIIQAVLAKLPPDTPLAEKRKAISAAYPFGAREMHPYKIWCSAVNIALGIRKKHPANDGPDLFQGAE